MKSGNIKSLVFIDYAENTRFDLSDNITEVNFLLDYPVATLVASIN